MRKIAICDDSKLDRQLLKVVIQTYFENNEEELYEETEIAIDYLTETDKVNIQNGIRVNGNENLNQLIEDFE